MKPFTKKIFELLGYILAFILIYAIVNYVRSPILPRAPQLTYQTSSNTVDVIKLSHNTPVLVYFWGTWCHICKYTSPSVQKLYADEVAVISVAVNSGDNQELERYMIQHQLNFPTINDESGDIFRAWQGQVTPSFVILKNGQISQSFTGINPLWTIKARLYLSSVL